MSVFQLLWRNMMHRKTLSLLTIVSIAITIALLLVLLQVRAGIEHGAEKGYGPFELTLGSKGSSSQLVLNTYYRVGTPAQNIPQQVLHDVLKESEVAHAYAMTAGDSYQGYPIVGMDAAYFYTRYGDQSMKAGGMYAKTGEAVIGSHVASQLGLRVGDTFHGNHGLVNSGSHSFDNPANEKSGSDSGSEASSNDQHQETHSEQQAEAAEEAGSEHSNESDESHHDHEHFEYRIVGILPTLGTADDRAVFTTLDYAWHVHGITHEEDKRITAILVQPKSLLGAQAIKNKFNQRADVQAVYTSKAVADVVNVVDRGTELVQFVSLLCVLLAAITLLLSLTSVVTERKKDVGLMRLIGKSRLYVWTILIGEGLFLTGIGAILGLFLGHLATAFSASSILEWSGVHVDALRIAPGEIQLVSGALIVGFLASIGPAWKVYRVDPLQLFRS